MKKFINSTRWALILFLALGLMASGCTKEEECDDCLETFRCKINGEKWSPQCDGYPNSWCPDIDCQFYIDNRYLSLYIVNDNDMSRLRFSAYNLSVSKTRSLINLRREYKDLSRGNCASYDLIQSLTNYIELISIDTINYTVEGSFAFSVLGRCDGDTLHITDGYFHLAYRF
jgi:hypothetical protein